MLKVFNVSYGNFFVTCALINDWAKFFSHNGVSLLINNYLTALTNCCNKNSRSFACFYFKFSSREIFFSWLTYSPFFSKFSCIWPSDFASFSKEKEIKLYFYFSNSAKISFPSSVFFTASGESFSSRFISPYTTI